MKPATIVRVARIVATFAVWEIAGRVRDKAEALCERCLAAVTIDGVDLAVRAAMSNDLARDLSDSPAVFRAGIGRQYLERRG